jgi:hypothetical protein
MPKRDTNRAEALAAKKELYRKQIIDHYNMVYAQLCVERNKEKDHKNLNLKQY